MIKTPVIYSVIADKVRSIFNSQLDSHLEKGFSTYGHTLDDCPDYEYNWELMTIQELLDALQYQVKKNIMLERAIDHHMLQNSYKDVLSDVGLERFRQNKKWGHQRHNFSDWLMILTEEVGEVAQAMQKEKGWGKKTDSSNLYTELIQVAAVAVAIAQQVKEEGDQSLDS